MTIIIESGIKDTNFNCFSETEKTLGGCPMNFENLYDMFNSGKNVSEPTPIPESIYNGFLLPISYLDKNEKYTVSGVVSSDLELIPSEMEGAKTISSVYEMLCQPKDEFSLQLIRDIHSTYTTNVRFLEETQAVLSEMGKYNDRLDHSNLEKFAPDCNTFLSIWKHTKENDHFLEQYSFMEWSMLEHLNESPEFLQSLSVINILSPLFGLLIPIIFMIVPFALLRMRGIEITFEQYVDTLKEISKNHFIGKALNVQFTVEGILYLGFTAGLYFLQTYQNAMSCYKYYNNITKMNEHLVYMKSYIQHSILRMDAFVSLHLDKPTYAPFCKDVQGHMLQLRGISSTLENITPFSYSISTFGNVGYMLNCYYQLSVNPEYEKSIRYSIGFGAYADILSGIHVNIQSGHLGNARFIKEGETTFENQYYPAHLFTNNREAFKSNDDSNELCVRNNCDLSQNIIITGVNASGKTTFLKTTAINILVSQQFGVGFYSGCSMCPFTHIHSYLNIPDTSGRDSLFQAESRRCKEIIDIIEETKEDTSSRHFAIFDELYSGTNPEEATKSATSLLKYLSKFDNVRFILTTHYVSVCKKFRKSTKVCNYKMNVKVGESGTITYLYTIKKGISKIQGGVEILKKMNYPAEIVDDIQLQKRHKSKCTIVSPVNPETPRVVSE